MIYLLNFNITYIIIFVTFLDSYESYSGINFKNYCTYCFTVFMSYIFLSIFFIMVAFLHFITSVNVYMVLGRGVVGTNQNIDLTCCISVLHELEGLGMKVSHVVMNKL
jgi:hypothetical protein